MLQVGSNKKLDPTFNSNPMNICALSNQESTLMIISHILVVTRGSKVGTLPPCWDLLTWVGLGPCVNHPSYLLSTRLGAVIKWPTFVQIHLVINYK